MGNRGRRKMLVESAQSIGDVLRSLSDGALSLQDTVDSIDRYAGAFEGGELLPGRIECGPLLSGCGRPRTELEDVAHQWARPLFG